MSDYLASSNYTEQGGTRTVIQGSLDVVSGGDLDIESGATWKIGGVAVTATAEQLNSIDSVTEVANKSGGDYTAGTLVYISGYDTTLDCPIATKADADDATKKATLVLTEAIANNASGSAEAKATVGSLDTSSASAVGALVYESTTAGEFTFTAPTDANDDRRCVGTVKVKDASDGEIYFFPGEGGLEHAAVYLNNLTPGTVSASGAVVVDSNKHQDVVNVTTLSIGASGSATAVTSTAAELNYLDLTTGAGTQEANKAVVADSNVNTGVSKVTELHIGASGSETQVTATAAELNYLDLTTGAGTQEANKAVVADSNVNTGVAKITELHIGASGSETQVTATAAELNYCDVTAGTAAASKAVVLGADAQLDVQTTVSPGASPGHIIKMECEAAGTYSGTNAGLQVKNYDADGTVVHDGGENAGLAVWLKTLSEPQSGGEYAIITGHMHSSNTGTIKHGLILYGNFTNGIGVSGGTATNGLIFENQTLTNLFALADGAEAKTASSDYCKTNAATSDAAIKITIGGVDYFVPAFNATNTNNSW